MNSHNVSLILKEIVRRVMTIIQRERFLREYLIEQKEVEYKDEDFVTSADKKAQDTYLRLLQENFPGYGIIAEENNLSIPCTLPGQNLCFFVDPLDGTKAYIRKQSHAISTMLALVDMQTGKYLSCVIGDINTGEIYYFRPGSENIHRMSNFENYEPLVIEPKPLSGQYLLLRDDVRIYSQFVQEITLPGREGRLFKSIEIEGGSIGTMIMRLIKGEVGAVALLPGKTTPWDANPVNGFLKKLGFVAIETRFRKEESLDPIAEMTEYSERIIVHKENAFDIQNF